MFVTFTSSQNYLANYKWFTAIFCLSFPAAPWPIRTLTLNNGSTLIFGGRRGGGEGMGIILGMSIFLAESLAPAFNMAEGEHMNFWLLEEQKFPSSRQGSSMV